MSGEGGEIGSIGERVIVDIGRPSVIGPAKQTGLRSRSGRRLKSIVLLAITAIGAASA